MIICKNCGKEFNVHKPRQIFCCLKCFGEYRKRTHGFSGTHIYTIYMRMKRVCNNTNDSRYKRYGGRGIKLLWTSFEEFKKDMYESYLEHFDKYGKLNTTIERIDNNGNYSRVNCKWATRKEQAENRNNTIHITFNGETHSIKEWSRIKNMNYLTLYGRIKSGWDIEKALNS